MLTWSNDILWLCAVVSLLLFFIIILCLYTIILTTCVLDTFYLFKGKWCGLATPERGEKIKKKVPGNLRGKPSELYRDSSFEKKKKKKLASSKMYSLPIKL